MPFSSTACCVDSSLEPPGEEAIRGFYKGIPRDEAIPWIAWVKPLFGWLPTLLGLCLVMVVLPMLFRRQWIKHERLAYPLAQLPLLMGVQEPSRASNSFCRSVVWLGFAYLVHREVAMKLWLYHLICLTLKGYFNTIGLTREVTPVYFTPPVMVGRSWPMCHSGAHGACGQRPLDRP